MTAVREEARRGRGWQARWPLRGVLGLALSFGLSSCMTDYLGTPPQPTLVFGRVTLAGTRGEVVVYVASMPAGGVASVAVAARGVSYSEVVPDSIRVAGLNGFVVLAQDFTTSPGAGAVVAVNPACGVVSGPILRFTFEASGGTPVLWVRPEDKDRVTLGSDEDVRIDPFDLGSERVYYAR